MNIIDTLNSLRNSDIDISIDDKITILAQKVAQIDRELVDVRKTLGNLYGYINILFDKDVEVRNDLECLNETVERLIREVG